MNICNCTYLVRHFLIILITVFMFTYYPFFYVGCEKLNWETCLLCREVVPVVKFLISSRSFSQQSYLVNIIFIMDIFTTYSTKPQVQLIAGNRNPKKMNTMMEDLYWIRAIAWNWSFIFSTSLLTFKKAPKASVYKYEKIHIFYLLLNSILESCINWHIKSFALYGAHHNKKIIASAIWPVQPSLRTCLPTDIFSSSTYSLSPWMGFAFSLSHTF